MTAAFLNEYDEFVSSRIKPGAAILASLTPEKVHMWHMVSGIAGEAGEILDAVKKWAVYGKDLDVDNVIEELGDLEFYISGARQFASMSRDEILSQNMSKLSVRYKDGYSDQAAIERADKAENA
jgi:NTP pyrophosphatase (non-canonical NTP hydrolase)